jgi:choline monooxygenase
VERRDYQLACNWKVYVDNYLDGGYHINSVHPSLGSVLDYSQYGTDIGPWVSVQHSPLCPPTGAEGADVASVRTGDRAQYWWIFPNVMLNHYQEVMDTNLVLPLGPDRCRVVFDFYVSEGTHTAQRVQDSVEIGHRVQMEDVGICEEVQRGLGSRSFDAGRYSVRREGPVHHFHQLLARRLRADP